ncbi:MAG: S9 family peptidase [Acidobacteria bacterium]|nr:S9 family peptidase [Acidobacteriota bacterium]
MERLCVAIAIALLAGPAAISTPTQSQAGRPGQAAETRPALFELSVDSIMRGPDLVGYPPSGLRWSADSQHLYFQWRKPGEEEASTYVVSRHGGEPRKLSEDESKNIPPAGMARWDKARRRVLTVDAGDIVLVDATSGARRQITRTTGAETNPRWARHDTHITYIREGHLYIVPVDEPGPGLITQLTDNGPRRPEPRLTESQQFIKDEEAKLIEYIRQQNDRQQKNEERARENRLPGVELQERQSAVDVMLSPDDTHAFVIVSERPTAAKPTIVPNYVTTSGYTEDINARVNVGEPQERRMLAVLNLQTGKTVWADGSFAPPVVETSRADDEKAADAKPDAGKPTEATAMGPDGRQGRRAQREIRWSTPVVSEDGRFVVASARSADNKDRWHVVLDPESGKTRVVDHLTDEAWVRESGFGGGVVQFLPDNRRLAFMSERDGWNHLYTLDVSQEGAQARQLTSGQWEVAGAEIAPDGSKFYITTSEVHPGERHLYTLPFDGGERTKITSMTGSNQADVSPDETMLGIVHSYSNKPPEVYLAPNKPGAQATQITTTPTEEWRGFKWIDPKVVTFKARDGVDVHARVFTPEMVGARRDPTRPGVVFVHGAGYLQNVHKYWSTYFREYMFHNLLAARGYVVLDVDYRASSGYGRDWRTAIYRHMGGKDLEDIVDGAKYLAEHERVDPRRLGVYGGSYGGFITLMAMFTTPDVFAAGAALRPVTDWARYNHGYTSNILNVPQRDAEAYRKSSPIYFAEGLTGALLICHGMVDTNVHFQDSVRLAQRLIELRKENWELAVYPVENHGFTEETSWADEYKRILKLFEDNLRLKGARSAS